MTNSSCTRVTSISDGGFDTAGRILATSTAAVLLTTCVGVATEGLVAALNLGGLAEAVALVRVAVATEGAGLVLVLTVARATILVG